MKELQDKHEMMYKRALLAVGALKAKQDNRGKDKKRLIAELRKVKVRVKEKETKEKLRGRELFNLRQELVESRGECCAANE